MVSIIWKQGHHLGEVEGTDEIIKEIVDFPGFYVSSEGRVFSAWIKGVRPLRADYSALWEKKQFLIDRTRKSPYWHVSLKYRGVGSVRSVHRLVALHFVKNKKPGVYNVVNHLKYPSNAAKDLEWNTQAHNCHVGDKTRNHLLRDPTGKLLEIRNLKRFCRENNLSTQALYNQRQSKGYQYLGLCH